MVGDIHVDEEHGAFSVELRKQNYKITLDMNLLVSPEFRELENLYNVIKDLGKTPYRITTKDGQKQLDQQKNCITMSLSLRARVFQFSDTRGLER